MARLPTIKELMDLHPEVPDMQTIEQWCEGRCSRSHYYRMDDPPETIDMGGKRMILRLGILEWMQRRIIEARQKKAA